MIQEGGISPLLGRFKGIPKGEIEIPLWYSFFRPSTALSFSYEKESGVENYRAFGAVGRTGASAPTDTVLCPPGIKSAASFGRKEVSPLSG